MKISRILGVPFLLPTLILLVAASAPTDGSSTTKSFVECLETFSQPSHPISKAIYTPINPSYPSVLQFYIRNLRFNETTTKKPSLILTALHVSHIQAAVLCAKSNGLHMRIRSGGHDFEGVSSTSNEEPFFILDMFNLRAININVEDETAWVEAGATLGELYYTISEKSNVHGFPGGTCPTVGIGGFISGGGYGILLQKYGLAADNVVDAKLVDVNGNLLDRSSMGEDLFWAITGGGASSFGVVLAYKIRLVRVPPVVTFAGIRIPYEQNLTEVVHKFLRVGDKLNENMYTKLGVDVVEIEGKKTVRGTFLTLYLGRSEGLVDLATESFPELGLKKADCLESTWIESLVHWVYFPNGTQPSVLLSRINPGSAYLKRKSDFLKKPISRKGIDSILKKMMELETPVLKFFPLGGIMNEISPSDKPFPHRAGNIALVEIATNWNESGIEAAKYYINMTNEFYDYMAPFVSKSRAAYANYRDFDLGVNHHGPNSYLEAATTYGFKYFKKNFAKLVRIKSRVDPENFFRNEQSIPTFPLQADA